MRTPIENRPHTILVVEDEVLIRMDTSDALRRLGYDVLEAGNADEALEVLGSGVQVSIVFTDVQMPGRLNGIELAAYVQTNYPETFCVLTSAHLPASDLPRPPPGPFIAKPYLIRSVAAMIERHLPANTVDSTIKLINGYRKE